MKIQLRVLALTSLLCAFFSDYLFSQDITFKRLPEFDQNEFGYGGVTDITQDPDGYMWFGTLNGLYRYDGYQVISYHNVSNDPQSLVYDHINTVYADEKGLIWIGTNDKGMDCLNPKTGIFKHFTYNAKDEKSISNNGINMIRGDKKGFIWVATHDGLNYFNTLTGKSTRYMHKENDPNSIAHNQVWIIYKDREGTAWFGAGAPFSSVRGKIKKGGLMRYNPQTDNFTNYLHNPDNPKTLIDNRVTAIFEDSRGTFWVGTMGDGLHTMNRANGTFERHTYEKTHPEKLSRPPLRNLFPYSDDYIAFINEDAAKRIWIGTFSGGMNLYDPVAQKITFFDASKDTLSNIVGNSYFRSYISRDSIFWIAPWLEDLVNTDPFLKKLPYTPVNESIKGVIKENEETLWLYGKNGLTRKDLITGLQKKFIHKANLPNSLSHNDIRCIVANKDNKWWIATYGGGLDYFDPVAESFIHYKHDPQDINTISSDSIDVVYTDGNNLWIGTRRGLDAMNLTTGKFSHFIHNTGDPNNLGGRAVKEIYILDKHTVLLGMGDPRGMNVLNLKEGIIHEKYYLAGNALSDIFKDHSGTLWVTTGEGLFRYDSSAKIFSPFTDPNRLTKFGSAVNIQEDDKKNLWLFTHLSIYKINAGRDLITAYGDEYGVQKNDWNASNKFIQIPKEEMFLIDNTGYFSFKPGDIKNNPVPPQIVISDFHLTDDSANDGSGNKKLLANQRELVLAHQQNTFSIEFLPIHFGNPAKNKIVFKLDNIDADWRDPGNERKAYYFNLPPGKYTFHLKARNYTGVLAERQLTITITPPWWKTWWAYVSYVLIFLVVLRGYIKWRERALKKEAALKQQKTEFEMKALRAQMNPHFIFNSLHSINKYVMDNDKENASEYLSKFSKLMRLILENSRETEVPLEKDLSALELYMQLESLRFQNRFEYDIEVDPQIDMESTLIPPMLLQPFVENSIIHGLSSKETGMIRIRIKKEDNTIRYIVEDNGVGRQQPVTTEQGDEKKRESLGMKITQERLQIINQLKNVNAVVNIYDLKDEKDKPAGLRIELLLPFETVF